MQHVLTARQFTGEDLEGLFNRADAMRDASQSPEGRRKLLGRHAGSIIATLFYEPSTRTRLSFESAAQRLGMGVISTENARDFSSASKGETIEDTIRVVAGYADLIAMRHNETGAAAQAAAVSRVPIINAGDGKGEHPTQALLDAYTIQRELGKLSGLHVVLGGDLANGRTARSLVQLLASPDNHFTFISTPELRMGDDIKDYLEERGASYTETDQLLPALNTANVVYWTRLQKERLEDPTLQAGFTLGTEAFTAMPESCIVMHPLPRVGEIDPAVDGDPRAAYFRQAENGLYLRMALMDDLMTARER